MRNHHGAQNRSSARAAGGLLGRIDALDHDLRAGPSLVARPTEATLKRRPIEDLTHGQSPNSLATQPAQSVPARSNGRAWAAAVATNPPAAPARVAGGMDVGASTNADAAETELPPQVAAWLSRARRQRRLDALRRRASWLVSILVSAVSIAGAASVLLK